MRYLKIASAKNPDTDFIELNDFNGFLCTSFQTLGISRKLEFLEIQNRQFSVSNKPEFKKYGLTIEILTKYSEYEAKYSELITFIDRNKKDGFRLYYRPYDDRSLRYCLCDIERTAKIEKLQPVMLTVAQNSLWFGEEQNVASMAIEQSGNLFAFSEDSEVSGYYCVGFFEDSEISNYYCIDFYSGVETKAEITNNSYNEIPLKIRIYGACENPTVSMYKKEDDSLIRQFKIEATINSGYYLEVNADIEDTGVWLVNKYTLSKISYDRLINYEVGSPYFYVDHGDYYIIVRDEGSNICDCNVAWKEEYSE